MSHYVFNHVGLKKANSIVNAINTLGGVARIDETWMDYGAEISWETILVYSKSLNMDYQLLSPRDFEEINNGTIGFDRVQNLIYNAVKSNVGWKTDMEDW